MSLVLLDKHEGYAILTLNRPEAMNALSADLISELAKTIRDCASDDEIRVLIFTGAGKAFCAGLDLKELGGGDGSTSVDLIENDVMPSIDAFDGPIIAAVNGHAITGGFELALAADVIIASENARFADTHGRVGILPGWGLSQKLSRLIGLKRAQEISFTGLPVFAEQALAWGLVNHVVSEDKLLEKAIGLAEAMLACVPDVLVKYKRLILDGYSKPYDEALAWEQRKSIESARQLSSDVIESRRQGIIDRGRSEN